MIINSLRNQGHLQESEKTSIKISSPNNSQNQHPKGPEVSSMPKTKPQSKLSFNLLSIAKSKFISSTKNSLILSLNNFNNLSCFKFKYKTSKVHPIMRKTTLNQNKAHKKSLKDLLVKIVP